MPDSTQPHATQSNSAPSDANSSRQVTIRGMSCGHCRAAVEAAIREVPGVKSVNVDLERGLAIIDGQAGLPEIVHAVEEAGYEAAPAAVK